MALIRCSECGAYVSEKASVCPKCGCPLDITKQVISEERKENNKKRILGITSIICLLALIIIGGYIVINNFNKPGNVATRIVKKDFGKNVDIENIYYNSEINGCIVEFSVDGKENAATVHLDSKTAGYESVLDEYSEKFENASNESDKLKYGDMYMKYMDEYVIPWRYNLLINGEEKSGWERIK